VSNANRTIPQENLIHRGDNLVFDFFVGAGLVDVQGRGFGGKGRKPRVLYTFPFSFSFSEACFYIANKVIFHVLHLGFAIVSKLLHIGLVPDDKG
jgi:hypothetical protein